MGARSNKTLREKAKQSKSAAAAAAMKKFKKKPCSFCRDKVTYIDYKDIATLRKYITDRGKIRSRRITGACTQHQRAVAAAVKNSREMALLPYTSTARVRINFIFVFLLIAQLRCKAEAPFRGYF